MVSHVFTVDDIQKNHANQLPAQDDYSLPCIGEGLSEVTILLPSSLLKSLFQKITMYVLGSYNHHFHSFSFCVPMHYSKYSF